VAEARSAAGRAAGALARALRFGRPYGHAILACVRLFTLGVAGPEGRGRIVRLARDLGYRDSDAPRPALSRVPYNDLAPDTLAVELREPVARDGNVTLLELLVIARLVRRFRPTALFEFGTYDGRTTLNLAANAPDGAAVYTLDLPRAGLADAALPLDRQERQFVDKEASGARFHGTPLERAITQLYGDSASFDYSPYAGTIDFVFVDASHAYEYVLNDSAHAIRLLRAGRGVVVWHDYGVWDGVTRALDRLHQEEPAFAALRWIEGTTLACLVRE
jgi:predicted O-methyltransferase YrrM